MQLVKKHMKTNSVIKMFLTFGLIIGQRCHSQGFINLDFEAATIKIVGTPPPTFINESNAIPGWSAYTGPTGNPTNSSSVGSSIILYDGVTTGGAMVSLQNTSAVFIGSAIQGNYSVLLVGSIPAADGTASIGQSGTIPITAQSLTFWGILGGTLDVSFNGSDLTYSAIGSGTDYTIYAVDISAYAGQLGQLLFTSGVSSSALLDNIQFSTTAVPEPSVLALTALGGLLLGFRRWKMWAI